MKRRLLFAIVDAVTSAAVAFSAWMLDWHEQLAEPVPVPRVLVECCWLPSTLELDLAEVAAAMPDGFALFVVPDSAIADQTARRAVCYQARPS